MVTTTNPTALKVNTGAIPGEGRMAVPFNVDFTAVSSYTLDLTAIQQMQSRISFVQAVFVDNSSNLSTTSIYSQNTGQTIIVPPQSQAYLPLVISNQITAVISSSGGVIVPMQFLNFGIAPCVWGITGEPTVTAGKLQVQDTTLEAGVVGGVYQMQFSGNRTYSSYSGTITTGGTAQTIQAATPTRNGYRFQNLSSTDTLWLNDQGGTASVGGTDCIEIPPTGLYETQPGMCSPAAISIIGATTGDKFTMLIC